VVPEYPSHFDLHTHSRRSDGVLEPADLVGQAAAAGVRVLALTDHDTLAGARELCAPGAPSLPLELIAGVEINTLARGLALPDGELHILGLGVDTTDEEFEATLLRQRDFRVTRFQRIVDRLRMLGYPIDDQVDEYLATSGGVEGASMGRPQIARCLVAAGFASSVDDAMQRLLTRGKPAFVPREGLGPGEAISAIRGAGGLPSLAHFAEADERFDLVKELAAVGLGGIEVNYRHFDIQTTALVKGVARDLRLVPTGGSDYHGDTETYAEAHRSLFVPDEVGLDVLSALGRGRLVKQLSPYAP
jgi:predicted metal-dependent phosphoesterase TrpH